MVTSGEATRSALRAAGAQAATTGTTLHLPGSPSATPQGLAVLAHELSHAADASPGPHFLLHSAHGAADAGERRALQVGETTRRAASGAAGPVPGGGVADRLVAGGASLLAMAREAVHTAVAEVGGRGGTATTGPQPQGPIEAAGTASAADGPSPSTRVPVPASHPVVAGAGNAPVTGIADDQVSELMVALEERLLAELERRGGRYAGVF